MPKHLSLLSIISVAAISSGCSDVAAMPAGPSPVMLTAATLATPEVAGQNIPVLTGRWRVSGTTAFRNLDTGNLLNWGGCLGSLSVTGQDGLRFNGALVTQGGGFNSDRFCTASGTLTGELLERESSAARARLDGNFQNWPRPSVSPSCEMLSAGDGTWTGSATADAIRLQVRDVLRCAVNVDGGIPGMPTASFERTVSLSFERW